MYWEIKESHRTRDSGQGFDLICDLEEFHLGMRRPSRGEFMEREATSGYHRINRPLVRSVQIPSGKCRLTISDPIFFVVFAFSCNTFAPLAREARWFFLASSTKGNVRVFRDNSPLLFPFG
jgi:hypothetical protein